MERRKYGNIHSVEYSKNMFSAPSQNEIVADTNGIPVVYAGVAEKRGVLEKAYLALNIFERKNKRLSVKNLLNNWKLQ